MVKLWGIMGGKVVQEASSHASYFKLIRIYKGKLAQGVRTHCVINHSILGRMHFPCFVHKPPFDVNFAYSFVNEAPDLSQKGWSIKQTTFNTKIHNIKAPGLMTGIKQVLQTKQQNTLFVTALLVRHMKRFLICCHYLQDAIIYLCIPKPLQISAE